MRPDLRDQLEHFRILIESRAHHGNSPFCQKLRIRVEFPEKSPILVLYGTWCLHCEVKSDETFRNP